MKETQQINDKRYQFQSKIKIHDNSVMCVIILKDSRYASSSCDKTIKIFNKTTYKIDIVILEHKDYVAYIYQLKDEKLVSSSSDNTIKIFQLFKNSYNVVQILTGHSKPVKQTIELINGSLVSCSWDKTIKIWNKNNKNLYNISLQFQEMMEICSVFEINEKEFMSLSVHDIYQEENRAISFYSNKNGEFDIENIIDNLEFSGFLSNVVKIDEKYLLLGGQKKIYFIDINKHSIHTIFDLNKNLWAQSLCLLDDGNLMVGAEFNLLVFKIIDNNLELIFELDNIQKNNNIIDYGVISSIREDLNKNIIISLYNGEIKVFSPKIKIHKI